jgi:hypothetical protein
MQNEAKTRPSWKGHRDVQNETKFDHIISKLLQRNILTTRRRVLRGHRGPAVLNAQNEAKTGLDGFASFVNDVASLRL